MIDEPYEIIDNTLWVRDSTVTKLYIRGFGHGRIDFSALTMCQSLRWLYISHCVNGVDLAFLASLPRLKKLCLVNLNFDDWFVLRGLKALTALQISFCPSLLNNPLSRECLPPALRAFRAGVHCKDLSFLEGNKTIIYLDTYAIHSQYAEAILSMKALKQINKECGMNEDTRACLVSKGIKIADIPPRVWR